MGFYGNISNSNKSAFTFDRVYGNRKDMDDNISSDGVFLGRYVLVEYDDTPINIWPNNLNQRYYLDEALTEQVTTWKVNRLYKLQQKATFQNLNPGFYYWPGGNNATLTPATERVDGPYAFNYGIDVNEYGRGYDGTVWRKVFQDGRYRYVMMAELNAAVPSFHLVVRPPADDIQSPAIDTSDSTNLNYYMYYPTMYYERFVTTPTTSTMNIAEYTINNQTVAAHTVAEYETIEQYVPEWGQFNTSAHTQQYTKKYKTQNVDIYYNKLGFEPTYHQQSKTILHSAGSVNKVDFDYAVSGRQYNYVPGNHGNTAQDTKLWYIHLPGIGDAVHNMYDLMYGYKNTTREVNTWLKTSLSDDKIYDMKTIVGAINHVKDILGYNFSYITQAEADELPVIVNDENNILYFVGNATQSSATQSQRSAVSKIYYYRKIPEYVQNNGGEYYKTSDNVYRVANTSMDIIPPAQRYTVKYKYKLTELRTPVHQGVFGMFIDLQRRLGISEDNSATYNIDNNRDPSTIQGMINRAGDMLSYLDTSVARNRLLFTNQDGVMMTADGTKTIDVSLSGNHGSGTVDTIFPMFDAPHSTKTLSANGTWVNRYESISVTNNSSISATISPTAGTISAAASTSPVGNNRVNFSTVNQWLILAADNSANVKSIKWAHKLNGLAANYKDSGDSKPWLSYNSATNAIEVGPWIQSTSNWTAGTANSTSNLSASQINIPSYTFDAAGHMIGYTNYPFYLPHSFKTIKNIIETNSGSRTASVTEATSTIIADNSIDTLTFTTGNIWLDIVGDESGDKFTFAHHLNGLADSYAADIESSRLSYDSANNNLEIGPWIRSALNGSTSIWETGTIETESASKLYASQINIPSYIFDGAGHMVGWETKAFYLPHSFKTVASVIDVNGSSNSVEVEETAGNAVADSAVDTITLTTGNKWLDILCSEGSDKFTFGHHLNGLSLGDDSIYKVSGDNKPWLSYDSTENAIEVGPWVQETSDWTIGDTLDADHLAPSQINIPSYKIDAAGHIIGYGNYKFYLPHSFKSLSVTNSTAVTNSSAVAGTIVADTATDLLSLATANKWIQIAADANNDKITIGHVLTHTNVTANTRYGLLENKSIATLDSENNTFAVPEFTVDEAGHVIAAETHTIVLPENFTTVRVNVGDSNETTSPTPSNAVIDIEADTLTDMLTLQAGNAWMILNPSATDDKITFYHKTVTPTTPTNTIDLNNQGTFATQVVGWDGAGHITSATTITHTLPYNWKSISVANSDTASTLSPIASTITANTNVDTVQFNAINKWLLMNATDHTVNFAHLLSPAGAHTIPVGSTVAPLIQFSTANTIVSFEVPNLTIDEAGHVTSLNSYTVTYPTPTFSTVANTVGTSQIATKLEYEPTNAGITVTYENLGAFLLTGYTSPANTTDTIAATDTLNNAIGKLVTRINTDEINNTNAHSAFDDRISNLEASVDTEVTGLLDRVDALEETIDTENTGLTDRVEVLESALSSEDGVLDRLDTLEAAASGYQPIEDENDPYAVKSYVDQAIAMIFANFSMILNPIEINAGVEDDIITPDIDSFAGTATIELQKQNDQDWNTVTESSQSIANGQAAFSLHGYTITENGTYRIAGYRTFQEKTSEWSYSEEIIIDDIIPPEPEPDPEQEPEPEPEEP